MTVDDVAEYLGLNREVVLRKARRGEIPAVKVGSKTYRFCRDQLDDWLKARSTVGPEAEVYPSVSKARTGNRDLPSLVRETTGAGVTERASAANKERQLKVLAEARRLQARMQKRLGKPLPGSAEEIRAMREDRSHRGS